MRSSVEHLKGINLVPYLPVTPTSVEPVSFGKHLMKSSTYSSCASSWLQRVLNWEKVVRIVNGQEDEVGGEVLA